MRRVMANAGIRTPEDLSRAVATPGDVRDALLAELTVGESYFFRESGPLEVLPEEIIPAHRESGLPIRVWSAGCASGEEPYSVVIRLREFGWSGPVNALGTDVALPRLAAARRALYTPWALRGVSPERVARWFGREGRLFALDRSIRDSVTFRPLNFVADSYPSALDGTADQDLILCRNVLIYFELDTVALIAKRLLSALKPDGWLLLGASDPPLGSLVDCTVVSTPNGVAYRRSGAPSARFGYASARPSSFTPSATGKAPAQPLPIAPYLAAPVVLPTSADRHALPRPSDRPTPPVPVARPLEGGQTALKEATDADVSALRDAYQRQRYSEVVESAGTVLSRHPDNIDLWILWIRALANTGDLAAAGTIASRALELHELDPELHYLHGLLLREAGHGGESVSALKRAVYLDRKFSVAWLLLADALLDRGDVPGAARAVDQATHSLLTLEPDALPRGSDGVSAGQLSRIAARRAQPRSTGRSA